MKPYLYLIALIFFLGTGFFAVRYFLIRTKQQKRVQEMIQSEKELASKHVKKLESNADLYTLRPGDTALVACNKLFQIRGEAITNVKFVPAVPGGYADIKRTGVGQFEIRLSCEALKNGLNIYPLIFTRVQGLELIVHIMPLSDLNGTLQFHTRFEIQ